MNDDQNRIWQYLQNNAVGKNNKKTTSQIRDACFLASGGPTNEYVRELVRGMIIDHSCCIGSLMWSGGYWIINSENELNEVINSLQNRANSIHRRVDAIRRNWDERE